MTQKEALDILKLGHNVFLTGPAGSGKTYLLNQYISYLKAHKITVGITASTGIASTHMGGSTIHSWTGMGIKDVMGQHDLNELLKRPYLRSRFTKTKVLIIDEISMLHAHRLDMVDLICRVFKHNSLPFGGMQVVMCGDFFQLPPVVRRDKEAESQGTIQPEQSLASQFVTNADIWDKMNLRICYLEEQHRQDDRAFLRVLNDIRNSEVNEMTFEYLNERMHKETHGYVQPTRLFTHNADVDQINLEQLEALTGDTREYLMTWRGSYGLTETLKKTCLAPTTLVLKKGAHVMFVKNNYEAGYVNGTLGEVIDFVREPLDPVSGEMQPVVRTYDGAEIRVTRADWSVKEDDRELAGIAQFPLRLAWAITVHKSQGMSLDAAEIDLSRSFIPGMGYVALSRVRSLSGLNLKGLNQMALMVNPDVADMDKTFHEQSTEAMLQLHAMDKKVKEEKQAAVLAHFMS